jgi:hypothetical protein
VNETPSAALAIPPLAPPERYGLDAELDLGAALPADHPRWQRDVLSLSARARSAIARLAPLAIRVLTFWDHGLRALTLGRRTLSVDPAGSYRLR